MIKCGNCGSGHESVEQVKTCYRPTPAVSRPQASTTGHTIHIPSGKGSQWANDVPASEKQVAYVRSLAASRGVAILNPSHNADLDTNPLGPVVYIDMENLTRAGASKEIDRLKSMAVTKKETAPLEAGMYRMDGVIYKVQAAVHGSGHLYAKQLSVYEDDAGVTVGFHYAKGVVSRLTPAHRMSLEDAKAFGALYGTCCVCGRTLTNETSIEAGIGPVCGGRV